MLRAVGIPRGHPAHSDWLTASRSMIVSPEGSIPSPDRLALSAKRRTRPLVPHSYLAKPPCSACRSASSSPINHCLRPYESTRFCEQGLFVNVVAGAAVKG